MITIITPDELEYIRGSSLPEMKVQIIFPTDGVYHLTKEQNHLRYALWDYMKYDCLITI